MAILLGLRCSTPSPARPPEYRDTLTLVYASCSSTGNELDLFEGMFI
jgi:hypothetical protein